MLLYTLMPDFIIIIIIKVERKKNERLFFKHLSKRFHTVALYQSLYSLFFINFFFFIIKSQESIKSENFKSI